MAANELFLMSVHELGHVFGLPHSNNASSVMYFLLLDGPTFLDDADLATLATRHKLRMMAVPSILTTQSAQSAHVSGSSYCAIRADDSHGCDSANSTVLSAR